MFGEYLTQWGEHALVFTGTYEHSIDAKNRVAIPSDVRAMLQSRLDAPPGQPLIFYVTLGDMTIGREALAIYTEAGWQKRADDLDRSELAPEELLRYERVMFSLTARIEMDSAGRIRLPDHLLKRVKLGPDVVLIGVKDHLEIRDRAQWMAEIEQLLAQEPHLITNPRQMMRRPPGSPPENPANS